jgi:hypothetical protein
MDNNTEELKFWYYIDKGEVTGPFSEEEMNAFYQQHVIEDSTEVWKSGMSDWVELSTTELSKKEDMIHQSGKNEINHALPWIMAFLPVLFAGAFSRKSLPLLIILLVIHCVIGATDSIILIKEGKAKKTVLLWALLLPPVYLVIRAGLLNTRKVGAVIWCILFAFELFVCAMVYDIAASLQPNKSEVVTEPEGTTEKGGITVDDFVKAYVRSPKYEITDEEEGKSLFKISGTMDYEGKEAAVNILFQVEEDGSVHFKEMVVDGESGNAELYYNLMDKLKSKID